jgi:hypothetical protein
MARTRSAKTRVSQRQFGDKQTRSNNALAAQVDPQRPPEVAARDLPHSTFTRKFPQFEEDG